MLARTVRDHLANPLLRRLYAIGALFMTVFGGVYTVIGYRLTEAPFSLPQGIIGSIFLVYLVGTVSASTAGRLVGRLGRRGALYLAGGTTAAGLLVSLADSLPLVLLGLVLITGGLLRGPRGRVLRGQQHGHAGAGAGLGPLPVRLLHRLQRGQHARRGRVPRGRLGRHGGVGLLAVLGVVTITVVGTRSAATDAAAGWWPRHRPLEGRSGAPAGRGPFAERSHSPDARSGTAGPSSTCTFSTRRAIVSGLR